MTMTPARTIVVGFDGSPTARGAVRFAAEEAVRRNHPLRIVSVRERRYPEPGECSADELLEFAAEIVRPLIPPGRVAPAAPLGPAVGALLKESDHADLLVLGRGEPRLTAALFGSVTSKVVPSARCPVVVVGDTDGPQVPRTGPVVVGIDLDEISVEALEEAFVEATLRSCELVVLYARPRSMRGRQTLPLGLIATVDDPQNDARLRAIIAPMREGHPEVEVTIVCRPGSATHELSDVTSTASMLVVGSRNRRPAARLFLGSVGRSMIRHANCPVLVAHPRLSVLAQEFAVGSPTSQRSVLT